MSHHLSTAARPALGLRVLYGLAACLVLVSGIYLGLYFCLNSTWAQRQLQAQLAHFSSTRKGTLSIKNAIISESFTRITLTDFELKGADARSLLYFDAAFFDLSLIKYLLGQDQSPSLHVLGKHVRIRATEDGQNDILEALSPLRPPSEDHPSSPPALEVPKSPDFPSYPAFRPPYRFTLQLREFDLLTPQGEGYLAHHVVMDISLLSSANIPVKAYASTGMAAASLNSGRATLEVSQIELRHFQLSPGHGFSAEVRLSREDGTHATLELAQSPNVFELTGSGLLQAHDMAALTGHMGLGLIQVEGLHLAFHSATPERPAQTLGSIQSVYTPWIYTEGLAANDLRVTIPALDVRTGALLPTVHLELQNLTLGYLSWRQHQLWDLYVAEGDVHVNTQVQVRLEHALFADLQVNGLSDADAPFSFGPGTLQVESTFGLRGGPTHILFGSKPLDADLTLMWRYAPLSKRTTRTLSLLATSRSLEANQRLFSNLSEAPHNEVPLRFQAIYELSLDEEQALLSLTDATLEPTSRTVPSLEDSP